MVYKNVKYTEYIRTNIYYTCAIFTVIIFVDGLLIILITKIFKSP